MYKYSPFKNEVHEIEEDTELDAFGYCCGYYVPHNKKEETHFLQNWLHYFRLQDPKYCTEKKEKQKLGSVTECMTEYLVRKIFKNVGMPLERCTIYNPPWIPGKNNMKPDGCYRKNGKLKITVEVKGKTYHCPGTAGEKFDGIFSKYSGCEGIILIVVCSDMVRDLIVKQYLDVFYLKKKSPNEHIQTMFNLYSKKFMIVSIDNLESYLLSLKII